MIVACSTLCFGKHPLDRAFATIAELGFSKVDVAIHEQGPHLRPSEVPADIHAVASRLRIGPGLIPCAFSVVLDAPDPEEARKQFLAICRLARLSSVPLLSVPASPAGTPLEQEAKRLSELVRLAAKDGIILTVPTCGGTVTEEVETTKTLCQRVAGLGLTLDPSHYVAGPRGVQNWDPLVPFVRHVRLRDTGVGPNQFQVRIGQGDIEYGRLISQLARQRYDRVLSVDIRDIPDAPFAMAPEIRKLKYLLESLV